MQDVGYAALQIIPSFEGFQGKLESGSSGALVAAGRSGGHKFGDSAGKSAGARFGTAFKASIAALGIYGLASAGFDFIRDSIGKASDLNETVNKSNVIFGENARQIRKWSTTAADAFGLSQEAALGSASTFGDMFSQIGFGSDRAAEMSKNVVQMAADFGSFNNLGTEDVLERISAGFRGEFDSLQLLVPNINAARVQQEALTLSHKESADQLTAQDKALATLNILHKDGARAMGDFQRTSGGLANQQKILNAQYDNASAKLGKSLLPLQLDLTRFINREGIPALNRFADWFSEDGAPAIRGFVDDAKPFVHSLMPAAATVLGDVRDVASDALPYVKGIIDAFNDMPDWAQKAIAVGGAGAVVGGKLGLFSRGGGGAAGGLLGAFSKATPLPVYVVNNGVDLPGGGKGTPGIIGSPGAGGFKGTPGMVGGSLLATSAAATGFGVVNALYEHPGNAVNSIGGYDLSSDAAVSKYVAMRRELEATAAVFATLPTSVKTDIILHGAPESKRQAIDLAKTYDLTKAQRITLFKAAGIPVTNRQVQNLIGLYRDSEKPRNTRVTADTSQAEAALNRVLALMNNINHMRGLQASGALPGGSVGRTAPSGSSQRAGGDVYLDGDKVGRFVDRRIGTHDDLVSESNRAGARR